jgi:hypothetical protein
MKKTLFYSTLKQEIEKIYIKVSLIVLHKRIKGYSKQSDQSNVSHTHDIGIPLLECIDAINVNRRDDSDTSRVSDDANAESVITDPHAPIKYQPLKPHVIDKKNIGDLSRYFKARSNGAELHPEIKEKLECSIWEHIHATIKYARQGDNRNAKMHADIVCSACKELAHYMSKDDYMNFIAGVNEHLDVLKSSA